MLISHRATKVVWVTASDLAAVVERIRETNRRRFSSADGWTNLRVLDFTFEERWIYLPELIQNAVDAGARRVAIDHGDDWLRLQHDGPEPLTEASVIGLSGLFQSTKDVGTVGFMGIGFKSVFRRFQRVRVSGFGWHFRFDVEVTTGEEYGDRQPDLLGTVLPFWDHTIAPPDPGFTTRFELREPQDANVSLASDVAHALPESDRTVLALLAHRGLQELRLGEIRWTFGCHEEAESQLATATSAAETERWRLFPVTYQPSKAAVARLLERRRIQPRDADRGRVYEEAARSRTVVGVLPVDEDDTPVPPSAGKAYALLPTASSVPFGLHVNADWLVTISRRGLPELEDNEWQNEIVDRIADVVAMFLRWLGARHHAAPAALRAGFSALRVPGQSEEGPIPRRLNSEEWKARLRRSLRDCEILPGFEAGSLRLRRPGETSLAPPALFSLTDDPDARADLLFGGPVINADVLSRGGIEYVRWLGLVDLLTPDSLAARWAKGIGGWWTAFEDGPERRSLLFDLWAGLSRLSADSGWADLPVVPTQADGWEKPGQIQFPNEAMPGAEDPDVAAFVEPHLPRPEVRPIEGLIDALRAFVPGPAGANRRAAREWFEARAEPVALVDVARAAVAAEVQVEAPRLDAIIRLAQWAMLRNRADLITHLVVSSNERASAVPANEAVLAEPYVEHGEARRRIWPDSGVVVADYVETDPSGADAHEWRVFLERLDVLGPVRLSAQKRYASRYQPERVAEFLGVPVDDVGESNNAGYQLIDYDFDPPLDGVEAAAVAGWLEEGHAALKGKEKRRAAFHYHNPFRPMGTTPAAWVDVLNDLAWVPCEDNRLRRPGDVLQGEDPAREDAPVATVSGSLIRRLNEAGVVFGARVPEAPVLRRLQKRSAEFTPQEFAETLAEAFAHVDAVPEDRGHLELVLRQIVYPNGRGGTVPFQRLIRTEGSGTRSGFGGWLAPLSTMPPEVRTALLDPRMPLVIPDRTTGEQALEYIAHVWRRAAEGESGLAQEVGDRLPAAYRYVLDDIATDADLAEQWEKVLESAFVFTNKRRWVAAHGPNPPAFGDVEDSLMRRFLPADLEVATGGHFGDTPGDQARVAVSIGLPRLSEMVSVEPDYGAVSNRPEWQRRFADLLTVLTTARRVTEQQETRITLRPTDYLAIEVDGNAKPVESFLEGNVLHVTGAPRDFAVDAVNHLVDAYGLSQQAKIAAMLTMLMSVLDDGELFASALKRFGAEFTPDFDLSGLTTIRELRRPTPPGKIERPSDIDGDSEGEDHEEKLKQAAEKLFETPELKEPEQEDEEVPPHRPGPDGSPPTDRDKGPTSEQRNRGLRGELELLRRLSEPEGYLRLKLTRDRRKDGCGYDFLCREADTGREIEVELKTYQEGGGVHLTLRELERARKSGERYALIGLVDDGGHPTGWEARRLDDPYVQLARLAEARIDVDFVLPAASIFPPG